MGRSSWSKVHGALQTGRRHLSTVAEATSLIEENTGGRISSLAGLLGALHRIDLGFDSESGMHGASQSYEPAPP